MCIYTLTHIHAHKHTYIYIYINIKSIICQALDWPYGYRGEKDMTYFLRQLSRYIL